MPFVVFSLPRSRSAWLSVLLSANGGPVGHDIGIETDTPDDFIQELKARGGTCETGAAFAWRQIKAAIPNVKFAVVARDPDEVIKSLAKFGLTNYDEEIYKRWEQLVEIASEPDVFVCDYQNLNDNQVVAELYKYCTGADVPLAWISKLQDMNVQVDMQARLERLQSRALDIANLKALCAKNTSNYYFQVEPWSDKFYTEVISLAEAHFEEVDGGIEPNRKLNLDTRIMQAASDAGSLILLTARKNGELVGYYTWQIALDVESAGLLIAQQGAWYVATGHPKAAFKLFDKSVIELRKRGVKCIFPHHRTQGRGKDLGKFFKRHGATLIQHTYSLWIGD
jgi:hypothetical protein